MKYEEACMETNKIRLHVVQAGPASGPPVVLLHGFPEFWYGWRKQIPALTEAGFRVIAPDQRGYNLSDKPKGVKAYRVEELVNDVIGLMDALDYEKVNLVGHDWGALVAWALAIGKPERVHRLSIMNMPHPAVMFRFLRRDPQQFRRSWYIYFFQLPWLPEAALKRNNWRNAERLLRGGGRIHAFMKEDMIEYKKAWSLPGAMTSMIHWYRAIGRYRFPLPREPRLRLPTLMLWGMKDVALTHRMARPSMDYCDDGRLFLFPEATHWVQHDEADEVNRLLIEFLRG